MAREMVKIGVANEKETNMYVDVLCLWEPKNITYSNQIVFFKHEDKYYSMELGDFKRIFNK